MMIKANEIDCLPIFTELTPWNLESLGFSSEAWDFRDEVVDANELVPSPTRHFL